MSDQYCLKWNNHHTTIVAVFDKLFECESLVDCTLAAEGKYLKAHKVVLSACSSYLEDLLQNHDDKHPILIFNDISYVELKAMLEYMYRGEVNVSQDQLNTFLKAAEALRIKGLTTDQGGGGGSGGGGGGGSSSEGDNGGNELKRKALKKDSLTAGSSGRAHSPTGQTSNDRPSSPKRKRRASSREENFANDSNSYDTAPTPPSSSGQNAVTKLEEKLRLKRESSETPSATSSHGGVPHKLLQPKTEFIEDPSNVEDVSLEDEEDYGPNPGTSQASFSSQDFNSWQMGEATGDEVFMGQHEMNNTAGNSQGGPTADGSESTESATISAEPSAVIIHQRAIDEDSSTSVPGEMVCGSQMAVTAAATVGETGQHYCLRWNNYQSNMTSVFHQLLRTQAFVDVTLACDDQSLKAHKVVLSACSSYFQKLLLENPCKHPTIIMPQDVCFADLKFIIEFVYKGEIDVSQTQLQSLLKTADQLKIKGLCEVPDGKSGAEVTPLILPASPLPSSHRLSHSNGVSGGGGGSVSNSGGSGVGVNGLISVGSATSAVVGAGSRRRRLSSNGAGGGPGSKRRLFKGRPSHHLRDDGNSNEGVDCVELGQDVEDSKDRLTSQLVVVDPQGRLTEAIVLTTASPVQSAHLQQSTPQQSSVATGSDNHDNSLLNSDEQLISVERQNGVVIDPLEAPPSEPAAPSATLVSTQMEMPSIESASRRDIAIDSSDLTLEENGGVKVKFETLRAMEHHHHMDMDATTRMNDEGEHHGMHTMMITPELLGLIPSSNSDSSEADSKPHSDSGNNSSTVATSSLAPGSGGKTWTQEDMDAALEALRKQTMSLSKASAQYGIPSTTLWQRAHRLGIDTPKKEGLTKTWNEDTLNTALEALRQGSLSANKASKAFGIPSSTLYKIARREGIRLAAPFNAAPTSWVPEDLERALDAIRSGQYTVQRAATEYGIPSGTLYGRCKREGIELTRNNPIPWSEDAMMEALEAIRLGHMSINQAAIHYNLPYSSLYGRFKRIKFDSDGMPTIHGDSEGSTGDVIGGPPPPQATPAQPVTQSPSQATATQQTSHQTPQIMLVQYQQPLHMYQSAT